MKLSESFPQFPSAVKLLYLSLIFMGCALLSNVVAMLLVLPLQGAQPKLAMWIAQSLGAIGSFLVPAVWFAYLESKGELCSYFKIKKTLPLVWMLAIAAMIAANPVAEFFLDWNRQWFSDPTLSPWVAKFREMSDHSEALMTYMLKDASLLGLLCNVFVVALLPAVCEEIFFRASLQNLLCSWSHKVHLSIVLTALVFSLFHLDLLGFIPRFVLGLCLGYAYYYGSLYVAVTIHFLNNLSVVMVYYLYAKGVVAQDPASYHVFQGMVWPILGVLVFIFCIFFMRRLNLYEK